MRERDIGLKPRKEGNLPPEKLLDILANIYGGDRAIEMMDAMGFFDTEEKEDWAEE